VMIARPLAWGLAVDGENGVRHVLDLVRTDLMRDLTLCGLFLAIVSAACHGSPGARVE